MDPNYPRWLAEQKYSEGTQNTQIYRARTVEDSYGNLDEHFANGTYEKIIDALEYSTNDERANKPNPSKLTFEGNIRNNLQSYKNAAVRYLKFLKDNEFRSRDRGQESSENTRTDPAMEEVAQQRFSLERDMQAALRLNIKSLDPLLRIIDDGAERAVGSGLIDITCEDGNALVVVELKAGKADSRAIGQILGYMGDLNEEEGENQYAGFSLLMILTDALGPLRV